MCSCWPSPSQRGLYLLVMHFAAFSHLIAVTTHCSGWVHWGSKPGPEPGWHIFRKPPQCHPGLGAQLSPGSYCGCLAHCYILKYLLNESMNWAPNIKCIFFLSGSLTKKGSIVSTGLPEPLLNALLSPCALFWVKTELRFSLWSSFLKECWGIKNLGDIGKIRVKNVSGRNVSPKPLKIVSFNLKWIRNVYIFTALLNNSFMCFKLVFVVTWVLIGLSLSHQNLSFSEITKASR